VTDRAGTALIDVVQDYAQAAVEVIVSDDVLRHIPIVRTITAMGAAVVSVRDEVFIRKLEMFLTALQEVPAEERREMVRRLEADPNYGRKVGEHLIELLDRVDSRRKPLMIARVFGAFAEQTITDTELHRLLNAIERIPTSEIDAVRRFVNTPTTAAAAQQVDEESLNAIATAGLVKTQSGFGGLVYQPNRTCSVFLDLNLDTLA
jgi:hypothetical protein